MVSFTPPISNQLKACEPTIGADPLKDASFATLREFKQSALSQEQEKSKEKEQNDSTKTQETKPSLKEEVATYLDKLARLKFLGYQVEIDKTVAIDPTGGSDDDLSVLRIALMSKDVPYKSYMLNKNQTYWADSLEVNDIEKSGSTKEFTCKSNISADLFGDSKIIKIPPFVVQERLDESKAVLVVVAPFGKEKVELFSASFEVKGGIADSAHRMAAILKIREFVGKEISALDLKERRDEFLASIPGISKNQLEPAIQVRKDEVVSGESLDKLSKILGNKSLKSFKIETALLGENEDNYLKNVELSISPQLFANSGGHPITVQGDRIVVTMKYEPTESEKKAPPSEIFFVDRNGGYTASIRFMYEKDYRTRLDIPGTLYKEISIFPKLIPTGSDLVATYPIQLDLERLGIGSGKVADAIYVRSTPYVERCGDKDIYKLYSGTSKSKIDAEMLPRINEMASGISKGEQFLGFTPGTLVDSIHLRQARFKHSSVEMQDPSTVNIFGRMLEGKHLLSPVGLHETVHVLDFKHNLSGGDFKSYWEKIPKDNSATKNPFFEFLADRNFYKSTWEAAGHPQSNEKETFASLINSVASPIDSWKERFSATSKDNQKLYIEFLNIADRQMISSSVSEAAPVIKEIRVRIAEGNKLLKP